MKVLMTADTVGGVWNYSLQLADALAPYDVEVHLATMGAPLTLAQRTEALDIANLTVHESTYKLEWMDDPWADVAAAGEWLLGLARDIRPDLVHLNGYAHGALPWQVPVLVVGHSCSLSWWEAVRGEPAPPAWDCYRSEVSQGLHAANMVVAPSGAMLAVLERHYGTLTNPTVIYNGRDASLFPPSAKEPLVLTVGRLWDEGKNVAALRDAATGLAWPGYVGGEEQHPEGGRVSLGDLQPLGRLSAAQLADWYGRAAVYALPARYEPFGLSALEAGLAGCALVLGDIPSLREIWGDAALFVPPNDTATLRLALDALIENPPLRAEMAQRARRRAMGYSVGRMVQGYITAYNALCSGEVAAGWKEDIACIS
ncbi:MAG: glycogen synthase [Chloroflexia bacterium]|jgi:glycosyltransferase involved in cell wall biosynthesis|nr:glycogen synthase [Chloroflexia bacterium]